MTSTTAMRVAWAPVCKGPFVKIHLNGSGVISVRASTASAFHALNEALKRHNYLTRQADTGAYTCRRITGGSAYSLHAYGIAADLNWQTNPYGKKLITDMPSGMIRDVEALRTNSGHVVFRWGGRYAGNKDAMHFEIICTPAQLATGIQKLPGAKPQFPIFNPHKGQWSLYPLNPNKPLLRIGATGGYVSYLQGVIGHRAGGNINIDGDFGPHTEQRVKEVQNFFKMPIDGIVGPKTWGIIDFLASR